MKCFALIIACLGGAASLFGVLTAPVYVWTDPLEHAFRAEVPKGWDAKGGLYRFAVMDTRPVLVATSPGGQMLISSGDRDVTSFAVPSQMLASVGHGEGSSYTTSDGVQLVVRSYVPGAAFAEEYVRDKFSAGCTALRFTARRNRTDLDEAVASVYARYGGMRLRLSTGEVAFECAKNGRLQRGYYLAATVAPLGRDVPIWSVQYQHGYLAPAAQADAARAALAHMVGTTRLDPAWVMRQPGIAPNIAVVVARSNDLIAAAIAEKSARAPRR